MVCVAKAFTIIAELLFNFHFVCHVWQKQQTTSQFITYTQEYSVEQNFNFHIWFSQDCYIKCTLLCIFYIIKLVPISQFGITKLHFFHHKKWAGCLIVLWCRTTTHFTFHHLYLKVLSGTKISIFHLANTILLHQVHLIISFHQTGVQKPIWYYHTTFFPSQKCAGCFLFCGAYVVPQDKPLHISSLILKSIKWNQKIFYFHILTTPNNCIKCILS